MAFSRFDEVEEDVLERSPGIFCCMRAMKPGMLSLDEGVG